MRLRWTHIVCLLGILSVVGCGKDSGTVPVTGTVTLDGVPVEGASVVFAPTNSEGQAAAGLTDDAGKFTLNCAAGSGALPGSYKVGIIKTDPAVMAAQSQAAQSSTDDPSAAYEAAEKAAGGADLFMGGARTEVEAGDLLPTKYKNPSSSGLTAEIKADGKNNLEPFELTTK